MLFGIALHQAIEVAFLHINTVVDFRNRHTDRIASRLRPASSLAEYLPHDCVTSVLRLPQIKLGLSQAIAIIAHLADTTPAIRSLQFDIAHFKVFQARLRFLQLFFI